MAYGPNVVGDISTYIQTIYEKAERAARDRTFLPLLVHGFADNSGTAIRTRSEYGTVGYSSISDLDDLTSQTFTPSTGSSLTPGMFGAQFWITDRRVRSDPHEVMTEAVNELGVAAATTIDVAIAGDFSSLTGGTVGSAGGTVTWGNFYAALALLKQQNAPQPYVCVLQPGQQYYLGTVPAVAGAVTNAPEFQNAIMREFWFTRVAGVDIYTSNNITSGTAAVGAIFSRDALAHDVRAPWRLERERDASKGGGGWELNATMDYAHGVWRPKFGVQIIATSVVA